LENDETPDYEKLRFTLLATILSAQENYDQIYDWNKNTLGNMNSKHLTRIKKKESISDISQLLSAKGSRES
jgi:hypothetical protein